MILEVLTDPVITPVLAMGVAIMSFMAGRLWGEEKAFRRECEEYDAAEKRECDELGPLPYIPAGTEYKSFLAQVTAAKKIPVSDA